MFRLTIMIESRPGVLLLPSQVGTGRPARGALAIRLELSLPARASRSG